MLTHDPKLDDPAITEAVKRGVGFIGALGSRRTQEKRFARLRESGLTEDELARVSGPVGLDIGAHTPEETAVSILAEVDREPLGTRRRPPDLGLGRHPRHRREPRGPRPQPGVLR